MNASLNPRLWVSNMPSAIENLEKLILPKVDPLVIPDAVMLVANELGLTVTLTCRDAPEQYEITRGAAPCGYIRVRWGGMSVSYPDAGDEDLFAGPVDGFGGFTDHEREAKLLLALGLIAARMLKL
ncbi:hypothetical protein ASC89_15695 [Devosia sp. Root413D1]|uniref:hypothetical protein n=1 Tax=unclassified Devosia TaxID=196773 RepID=UPI0006F638EC|nr:hypothetical protein [Devosia sp. Root413D1]KQW78232.1 hypothetical protein ASC89_15695 [Devosia sp. Root413D1]